ncbi:hypothetical protein ACSSS7_007386 [Eimeria intestinalis]
MPMLPQVYPQLFYYRGARSSDQPPVPANSGVNWTRAAEAVWLALCQFFILNPSSPTQTTGGPSISTTTARAPASARLLLQPYKDGQRVIAYGSRSLHDHEKKWTATQLEAAALIWALETFRHYIETVEVRIRRNMRSLTTPAIKAVSAAALSAGRCGSSNSDSRCSIVPASSRNTSTASREHPSRSIQPNARSFSTNFPAPGPPCSLRPAARSRRNRGLTVYAPPMRKRQKRPTRAPVCAPPPQNLCLAAGARRSGRRRPSFHRRGC